MVSLLVRVTVQGEKGTFGCAKQGYALLHTVWHTLLTGLVIHGTRIRDRFTGRSCFIDRTVVLARFTFTASW